MKFFYYKGIAPDKEFDKVYIGKINREGLDKTLELTKKNGTWIFRSKDKHDSIMAYLMAKDSFRLLKEARKIKFVIIEGFDIHPPKLKTTRKKRETKASISKRQHEYTSEDGGGSDMDKMV